MEIIKYKKLSKALADYLEDRKEPMDVGFLIKHDVAYTKRDIVREIRQETEAGQEFINDLIKLSLDLVIRGKEKLANFDSVPLKS